MTIGLEEVLDTIDQIEKDFKESKKESSQEKSNMLEFLGLNKNPFLDSIDTSFFFQTKQHEEVFLKMLLCIENDISLGMVHAASGTGKTLLSQLLLMNLDKTLYEPILILIAPDMTKTALLKEICLELSIIDPDDKFSSADLLRLIQDYIMDLYENENKKFVILIDEAHFLKAECLHTIRVLSNIELPDKKLITTILMGEESLWKKLQRPTYASIRSRMYQHVSLEPLSLEDTRNYVDFRLLTAGGSSTLFNDDIYKEIHQVSGGICRNINKVCYNLLIEAYIRRTKVISFIVVHDVLKKIKM